MDRLNLVEYSDTSIVINGISGLTLSEAQVGLNQFDEKVEDVSSDDGNEDTADDGEDEERVIESVSNLNISQADEENSTSANNQGEGQVSYASKGPMIQKRSRANVNAVTAPYRKNNHAQDNNRKPNTLSKERVEIHKINNLNGNIPHDVAVDGVIDEGQCNLGHFVDVATFLPELALNKTSQSSSLKTDGGQKLGVTNGKAGIPSLPDTSPTLNDGRTVVFPRVVVYKKPNVLWVPIPKVNIMIHPTLRKMGLHLAPISLNSNSPIEVENSEDFEIFIQLDNARAIRLRTTASISQVETKHSISIPTQFVELRPFSGYKGNSGIESLLEDVSETQIEDAISLVNGKDLTDLLKTYGPNEDSMLMHLCCKREEPPVIRAQVFALVCRILAQANPTTRANVIQKNSSGLSALDYTTVTNNCRLATFLADLYYMMGEDPTCPDISGNTLLHMLARKGDASVDTLRALIALRYSDDRNDKERGPYYTGVTNLKRFMPIHHAVMSRSCPRNVVETLYRDMPTCLTAETDNGSLPIHLACQYSSDRTMIALLLHYNKDVINAKRNDGFTPLHLVASRNDGPADTSIGLIPLDGETQRTFIYDLLDYGADKTSLVGGKYIPFDLVKANRKMSRALLKTPERRVDETVPYLQLTNKTSAGQNGINTRTTTLNYHPPNNLELKYTNPLSIKEENPINGFSNALIVVDVNESIDSKKDLLFSGNGSVTSIQSPGSSIDHQNRPPSSTSSLLSTLSPTSSVVMSGRDDPFICGGTTPTYIDTFNIGDDNNGSPISNGEGSQQQSPQSAVNHSFYAIYNCPTEGLGRISRASLPHPNSISTAANPSTFYNCYDSLSDSDGERVGTGDSGNESPSSDNPAYNRCIIQEAFGQQSNPRTSAEDEENGVLDVIAAQLYNHPTIQAVFNNADSNTNGGIRQTIGRNNL